LIQAEFTNNEDVNAARGKLSLIEEIVNRKNGQPITIEQMKPDLLRIFLLVSS
jgi:hypothetical protein